MEKNWYIIHTASGSEKKVKQSILELIAKKNMSEYFEDIVIPVLEVPDIRRGKAVTKEKKYMPGYVLIKMEMTDATWHLVTGIHKVSGFLGGKGSPQPLPAQQVKDILNKIETESKEASFAKMYDAGEQVTVIDGPFEGFAGVVEEVDHDKKRLKISVLIFGKATLIELTFSQVKKS